MTKEYWYLMYTASSGHEFIHSGPYTKRVEAEEAAFDSPNGDYLYIGMMTDDLAKSKYDYPR